MLWVRKTAHESIKNPKAVNPASCLIKAGLDIRVKGAKILCLNIDKVERWAEIWSLGPGFA